MIRCSSRALPQSLLLHVAPRGALRLSRVDPQIDPPIQPCGEEAEDHAAAPVGSGVGKAKVMIPSPSEAALSAKPLAELNFVPIPLLPRAAHEPLGSNALSDDFEWRERTTARIDTLETLLAALMGLLVRQRVLSDEAFTSDLLYLEEKFRSQNYHESVLSMVRFCREHVQHEIDKRSADENCDED